MLGFLESPKKEEAKVFYLNPVNGRRSFNHKCHVTKKGDTSVLTSYGIDVAVFNHKTNKMQVKGYYSATTAAHINAFLDFYGFDTCTKKELMSYNK